MNKLIHYNYSSCGKLRETIVRCNHQGTDLHHGCCVQVMSQYEGTNHDCDTVFVIKKVILDSLIIQDHHSDLVTMK